MSIDQELELEFNLNLIIHLSNRESFVSSLVIMN
jgi:hypothetical protein